MNNNEKWMKPFFPRPCPEATRLFFLNTVLIIASLLSPVAADPAFGYTVEGDEVHSNGQALITIGDSALLIKLRRNLDNGTAPHGKDIYYQSDRDQLTVVDHDDRTTAVFESPLKRHSGMPDKAAMDALLQNASSDEREAFEQSMEELRKQDLTSTRKQRRKRSEKLDKNISATQSPDKAPPGPPGVATMEAKPSTQGEGMTATKQDETIEIRGYECQKYRVTASHEDKQLYMWATKEIKLEKPKKATTRDAASFYQDIQKTPAGRKLDALFEEGQNPFQNLIRPEGIPIRVQRVDGTGVKVEYNLSEVSEGPRPALSPKSSRYVVKTFKVSQ